MPERKSMMAERRVLRILVFCLLAAHSACCLGQGADQAVYSTFDSPPSDLKVVSKQQYLAEIQQLQALVASCKAKADACDAGKVGDDVTVASGTLPGDFRFDVRRGWLRNALNDAKSKGEQERAESMAKASDRLDADVQEAAASAQSATIATGKLARAKADAILSRGEFRTVQPEGWLDRESGLVELWLSTLIDSFFSRLPHSSWTAPLIEWGLLVAAAVALIVWAWRVTQQQRVELSVPDADRQMVWQKESDDWARLAEARAAAEDWREAVHCLYWAAIVMLEGRRMWRPNRARTPREYLPLLEAGSPRQLALGGLTRLFERIWYGLRPAARRDFEQAQALLDELKAA
jgi:hypothetical protein